MILIIIYVDRRQFYEIRMYFFERKIQHLFLAGDKENKYV